MRIKYKSSEDILLTYASSVVRVELVSFPARAVVTSSGVHAVVSTSSVDIGAFAMSVT